jgi:hypothetical protein
MAVRYYRTSNNLEVFWKRILLSTEQPASVFSVFGVKGVARNSSVVCYLAPKVPWYLERKYV